MSEPDNPVRILVVCTGNICRSPAAERLLRCELTRLGRPHKVSVESAGVAAVVGNPIQQQMAGLLRADGVDVDDFEARSLTQRMIAGADLILAADRNHREAVVRLTPAALRRTFVLKEFVRLALQVTASGRPAPITERLHWLVREAPMVRGRNPVPEGADDIVDPFGQTVEDYRAAYDDLRRTVTALVGGPLAD